MSNTLQDFYKQVRDTAQEVVAEQIELFNAATRGALVLATGDNPGSFTDVARDALIADLVQARDVTSTDDVAAKDLTQFVETSVKLGLRAGPVAIDDGMWEWIGSKPEIAAAKIAQQLAKSKLQSYLSKAVKALVGATSGETGLVHDRTAGAMRFEDLNTGASKFGDRAENLVCWIMHSKVAFDIYAAALANTTPLFNYGTVNVKQDPFGRVFVVTDNSSLMYTSSGQKYRTLGLVPGAAVLEENQDYTMNIDIKNGKQNISRTWQAQWSANLAIKGYAWDKTNGGRSPTDAAIASASNWDQVVTSDKDLAGVMINSQ